jgi:hypothetical protein
MIVSAKTSEFVNGLETFCRGKLQQKEELTKILEIAFTQNKEDELDKLAFNAKYIQGLFRVLSKSVGNNEITNIEDIRKDLSVNIESTTKLLRNIIAENEIKDEIEKKYLELSAGSFQNYQKILSDLEWVKMYLNELKRSK